MALMNRSAKYILIETNGKKAGFIDHVLLAMGVPNATLLKVRFNQKTKIESPDRIVGRASGSMVEVLTLFQGRIASGAVGGFFKGSDAGKEIGELAAWREGAQGEVIETPDWFADLCIVEVRNISG
jgi:16S rRNA G527 N7-methylase RsmG